jgi:hypothetical protein
MIPIIPTFIRVLTYSRSDYEQFASRVYKGAYKVQSPSPEMLRTAAIQIRRQDRIVFLVLLVAIPMLAWTIFQAFSHH